MRFPDYVHSVILDSNPQRWPIQPQGLNECGCTAPANALNLLLGQRRFDKDEFIRQAGIFFQPTIFGRPAGSPSPITGRLIRRHGFGTHFGALHPDSREPALRDLIDRGVPVVIELGENRIGSLQLYGEHSVVLVGYSEPYVDAQGQHHEEYYLVDSQYPVNLVGFGLHTNDVDRDGDGVPEQYPGNRTLERSDFLRQYTTGIYFAVFPSQAEHDAWYRAHIQAEPTLPLIGRLVAGAFTGTRERWHA